MAAVSCCIAAESKSDGLSGQLLRKPQRVRARTCTGYIPSTETRADFLRGSSESGILVFSSMKRQSSPFLYTSIQPPDSQQDPITRRPLSRARSKRRGGRGSKEEESRDWRSWDRFVRLQHSIHAATWHIAGFRLICRLQRLV